MLNKKCESQGNDVPDEWIDELRGANERLQEALQEIAVERREKKAEYKKGWNRKKREAKKGMGAAGKKAGRMVYPDWFTEPLGEVGESSSDSDKYIPLGLEEGSDDGTEDSDEATTPTPTTTVTPTATTAPTSNVCSTPTGTTDPAVATTSTTTTTPVTTITPTATTTTSAATTPTPTTIEPVVTVPSPFASLLAPNATTIPVAVYEWIKSEQDNWKKEERKAIMEEVKIEMMAKVKLARGQYDKVLGQ